MEWWRIALPVNNGGRIPNPDLKYGPNTLRIYTKAAGESRNFPGRGIGAVIFPSIWCQVLQGQATNDGFIDIDGRSLSHKMSVWELVGPLLAISSVPNKVRNRTILALVDNLGSVYWWNKG